MTEQRLPASYAPSPRNFDHSLWEHIQRSRVQNEAVLASLASTRAQEHITVAASSGGEKRPCTAPQRNSNSKVISSCRCICSPVRCSRCEMMSCLCGRCKLKQFVRNYWIFHLMGKLVTYTIAQTKKNLVSTWRGCYCPEEAREATCLKARLIGN